MAKECGLLAPPCEYGVVPSGSVATPRINAHNSIGGSFTC